MGAPNPNGAENATVATPSPGVATTAVGVPGGPAGVTGADACDAGLGPMVFVATTVKVYALAFVSPEMVTGLEDAGVVDTTAPDASRAVTV